MVDIILDKYTTNFRTPGMLWWIVIKQTLCTQCLPMFIIQ
jgi:hypothetical protein